MNSRPYSLSSLESMPKLRGVLCDIDDTLTHHGRLVPEAFAMLSELQRLGLAVVPVTGRPGGWVDQIARIWPVDGVVGENGGLWYWFDGHKLQRRFAQPAAVRSENKRRLKSLADVILERVPGCALASDQPYRELDLAVDFCEDVSPLTGQDVDSIVHEFHSAGATCKVSSIHVNGWYGQFDKLSGIAAFHLDRFGQEINPAEWAFFGDSANDEPMFEAFKWSFGVANVCDFLDRITHPPSYITSQEGGYGFVEGMKHILSIMSQKR